MKAVAFVVLLTLVVGLAVGQNSRPPITNADVVGMTKSGIGEHTIVLAIEKGPTSFDTSPQALIALKKAGVADQVLNAMLAASPRGGAANIKSGNAAGTSIPVVTANPQNAIKVTSDTNPAIAGDALMQKALSALGPREKVLSIHALRWTASITQSGLAGTRQLDEEHITIYPDRLYISSKSSTGEVTKTIVTTQFVATGVGKNVTGVSAADQEMFRQLIRFEPSYIAQNFVSFMYFPEGQEQIGGVTVDSLKIARNGTVVWKIDSQTGRLLSSRMDTPTGEIVTEYSDYREVNGLYFAFKQHTTGPGGTLDRTIKEYDVNPIIDQSLFLDPGRTVQHPEPTRASTASNWSFTVKVLQAESVPYTQTSGGGMSTSCNISGTANTSLNAHTNGTTTYGNALTTSNLRMNCDSYDTTIRWPHVLNAMLVAGSDGISYIIACDAAWRWSKCVPLQTGDVFNARHTGNGIEVEASNAKGKEKDLTYRVLQSKSIR